MAPKLQTLLRSAQYVAKQIAYATAVAIIVGTVYLFNILSDSNHFPIQSVQIIGLQHIEQEEIKQTLVPLVSKGFFAVDVDYIRDRLQQMPWVAETLVRRQWPDRIEILIKERIAVARWNKSSLLSTEGDLFIPKATSEPEGLASFVGPDGQQITMLKYFVKINRILVPIHAKISYLELTPYLTWKLKLDNGMTLKVGFNDVLTRLTHFVKVYPKIVGERAEDVDYIDLRYPNGMAVKWKNAG